MTPYVDGEIDADARCAVEAHVRVCAPCHSRMAAERAVHDLLRARRDALQTTCASEALRTRCATLAGTVDDAADAGRPADAPGVPPAAPEGRGLVPRAPRAWRRQTVFARPAALA